MKQSRANRRRPRPYLQPKKRPSAKLPANPTPVWHEYVAKSLAFVFTLFAGIVIMAVISVPILSMSISVYPGWGPVISGAVLLGGFGACMNVPYFQEKFNNFFLSIEKVIIRFFPQVLGTVALTLVIIAASVLFNFDITPKVGNASHAVPTKVASAPKLSPTQDAISVVATSDQSLLGISNGNHPFDISLTDGPVKITAGSSLQKGDADTAANLWLQALKVDQNDAEALIYSEDQRVRSLGSSYFCLVVTTSFVHVGGTQHGLDGYKNGASRDILQGAYIAQSKYNRENSTQQMVLLIANIPDPAQDSKELAEQIERVRQQNKNVVGVVGWPFGSDSALAELGRANIPVVSLATFRAQSAANRGAYFFSVAPSIEDQAQAADQYAESTWKASKAAIFYDPHDEYSTDLAQAFSASFHGQVLQPLQTYTAGHTGEMLTNAESLIQSNPDLLIFFAGYPADAVDLINLTKSWPQVHVMGGDALYQMVHCVPTICTNLEKITFTAPAYPDEAACLQQERPAFFDAYVKQYDPEQVHIGNPYGFGRASSDSILAYDAVLTYSQASLHMSQPLTGMHMQQALTKIVHLQGASGQISFGHDGNPMQKAVFVLQADHGLKLKAMPVGYYNSPADRVFCA